MNKKIINILTHPGSFHADDIFSTALLKLYFKYKDKNVVLKLKRSDKKTDIEKADIVYDIGRIYDEKKLRFDHHQGGDNLIRENGIRYASFGLLFKKYGIELISLISKNKNKNFLKKVFAELERILILDIDAMDNGQLTYDRKYKDVDIFTISNYFRITGIIDHQDNSKILDKRFNELVNLSINILNNMITYSINRINEDEAVFKVYKKSKDKRIICFENSYDVRLLGQYKEPLVSIYKDKRGNWSAKVVENPGKLYDSRYLFPKQWRGLYEKDLEKVSGVEGAVFCHLVGFLCVNKTKEGLLKMIHRAFEMDGVK